MRMLTITSILLVGAITGLAFGVDWTPKTIEDGQLQSPSADERSHKRSTSSVASFFEETNCKQASDGCFHCVKDHNCIVACSSASAACIQQEMRCVAH